MTMYYIRREGRVEGPWDLEKLQSEVRLRKLGKYHEISEDKESWKKAGTSEELFPRKKIRKVVGGETNAQKPAEDTTEPKDPAIWYCEINGAQEGPMPFADLKQRVDEGVLVLDDVVWRDGWDDWLPIEDVPELVGAGNTTCGDYTDATRLVERPVTKKIKSKMAIASLVVGIAVLLLSCIPFVGFTGIGPIALGGLALSEIKKTKTGGKSLAITGIALGVIEIIVAIVLVLVGIGLLTWSSIDA